MLATLSFLALIAGGPRAQNVVDTMLREDYSCTAAEAVDVTIPILQATPSLYVDRCVRVVGYIGGRWFLNNLSDVHGHGVEELTELSTKFIGHQLQSTPYPEHESRVELIGRFRRCGDRYKVFQAEEEEKMKETGDTRPPAPVILGGTCHYMEYVVFSTIWHPAP